MPDVTATGSDNVNLAGGLVQQSRLTMVAASVELVLAMHASYKKDDFSSTL